MIASKKDRAKSPPTRPTTRCAIYTRKSTEEGLEQEFNSLDAQRESGEAYVKSQAHEGWELIDTPYDDGGFTGGNMDRPALRRLMADIEAGKIDCVIVYKVDRLSRSLMDFSRIIEAFDNHKVAFVSVTQQFNTANSMGRLMLNVLLSFAQFEREIISERTRDKIAASRRKGKWSGGVPVLGYDVDAVTGKLVVNEGEAAKVRAIFDLYRQHQSIITTVKELDDRDWLTKKWVTKSGATTGGKPFDKASLHRLLTNVTYLGKLRYKDEIHDGEHVAIVDGEVFREVQQLLARNARTGGAQVRNQFGAILKGILRCSACDCSMTPAHSTKKGGKRYRYYACTNAQKRGWDACPTKSVPAQEIENFVVDQIRGIGNDPALIRETVRQVAVQGEKRVKELEQEQRGIDRDLTRWNSDVRALIGDHSASAVARMADLNERITAAQHRTSELAAEITTLEAATIYEADVEKALAAFDPLWHTLTNREQARAMELLLKEVAYDGRSGKVLITFHAGGIQALAHQAEAVA
jgi:site-specific DNA recombinase